MKSYDKETVNSFLKDRGRSMLGMLVRKIAIIVLVCGALTVASSDSAWAARARQTASTANSVALDVVSAKAMVEAIIARRYSQELATIVDHDLFSLSAQVDLVPVAPPQVPNPDSGFAAFDSYNDLMLGNLDSDQLLKSAAGPINDRTTLQKLLELFRIKTVSINVGLQEELPADTKDQVDAWLKARLKGEFATNGKSSVAFIKKIPKLKQRLESLEDAVEWSTRNPSLAGQLALAVALLVGIVIWQILSKILGTSAGAAATQDSADMGMDSTEDSSDFASLAEAAKEIQADQEKEEALARKYDEHDRGRATADIDRIKGQLRDLVPRLSHSLEDVIRQWCNMGDQGRLRLVCFAEAAFRDAGKLPIPVDALPEVQKVFARMPEIEIREKREALEKAYWDLLSTLNLGSDSLTQPFSYIENVNMNMLNKVLMEENPRLQTLVSLHMSGGMRSRFMKMLPEAGKLKLLEQALNLNEIQSSELENMDRSLFSRINPTLGNEVVPLEMSFNKILETISLVEQITILPKLKGRPIEEYKRSKASLAFLHEWPDLPLKLFMMGLTPDELVSYLRVRPELKDRMLGLASTMVAEIAKEELQAAGSASGPDFERAIEFFNQRLESAVEQGDVNLGEVFGPIPETEMDPDQGPSKSDSGPGEQAA